MYLTIVKAVILILKHATFLRLSWLFSDPTKALIHAEQDYQEANIDWTIQQHLEASPYKHSVTHVLGFIMATDIGLFLFILIFYNNILWNLCRIVTSR